LTGRFFQSKPDEKVGFFEKNAVKKRCAPGGLQKYLLKFDKNFFGIIFPSLEILFSESPSFYTGGTPCREK